MLFIIFIPILILPIALKFNIKLSYTLTIIISFLVSIYGIFLNQDIYFLLITLAALNSIPLISYEFNKIKRAQFNKIDRNKNLTKETLNKLEKRIQDLKTVNTTLSNKVKETANLYEVTKKMSKGLKFEQVFKIFNDIIQENFSFKSCKFIVFKDHQSTDVEYFLEKKEEDRNILKTKISTVKINTKDKKIIEKIKQIKEPFFISQNKREPKSISLDFELENNSLLAIPLFSERKIMGILVITDLPYEKYFNILIFSVQFALQLKKVSLYEKIHELAIKDELTGVLSRRHFLQRFGEEFRRSAKHRLSLSFLMLDIDHFKKHNDKYGHLVGDRLLKKISDIIIDTVREVDLVGRFGGEEFAVVLPDTNLEGTKLVANRIREEIESNSFKIYDETINITVSLGACLYPENTSFFDDLINYADMALYRAKHEGRNRVCLYNPKIDKFPYHKK